MAKAVKLPSGNWRINKYIGTFNGKRKFKSFVASTKNEVEFLAAQWVMENPGQGQATNLTLGDAIDRYIENRSSILSPSTIREYKNARRLYFNNIMHIPLNRLKQEQIQITVNYEARNHSPKTVRNAHGLLSATLSEYAPYFKLRTKLPTKIKHEIVVPDENVFNTIFYAATNVDLKTAIILAGCLGLRRSEICALTWDDIKGTKVTINKAIVLNDKMKLVKKAPKSFDGTRTLEMPHILITYLDSLSKDKDTLISIKPNSITYRFGSLVKSLGIRCRFHDLRHYNASVMLALGVPDKYAMKRLGHATPNMLKTVYQHVMSTKQEEITTTINDFFNKKIKPDEEK